MATENPDASFESLLTYLRQSRAFDFTGYKRPSLMRRVTKRMLMVNVDNFSDYIDYLEGADEVKGQSLLNLDIGLPVGQVKGIIRPCFSGEADYPEVVLDATKRRGKAIKCRVTCTPLDLRHESPLKTQSKERHGVVLLMEEWEQ